MSALRIHTKRIGRNFIAAIVIHYTVWMEIGSTEIEAIGLLMERLPQE